MDKVSVIIPTYNRASELIKAIDSALNQTYPVFEIIVCDDGSSDNSKELVKQLDNPKVIWIDCGRNGMPAIPRNLGIQKATGDWLAFLDSDDVWLPKKIESQLEAICKSKHYLASSCNAFRIVNGEHKGAYQNEIPSIIKLSDLMLTNLVICSSAVIHKSLITKTFGFPEDKKLKAIEDYAFWLRISTQTNFVYLETCYVNYTDNPAQSIRSEDDETWVQREKIFDNFYTWCSQTNIDAKIKSMVKKEVKKAMKINGKSLLKRMLY